MSEAVQARIIFLFEHEIRLAAKALRHFDEVYKREGVTDEEWSLALNEALNAANAALWHADDESRPLILTSAKELFGARVKRAAHGKGDEA